MPLIYAVEAGGGATLAEVVDEQPPAEERVAWAIDEVRRLGGAERALAEARRFAERALAHLDGFPDGPAKHALGEITRFVVTRGA